MATLASEVSTQMVDLIYGSTGKRCGSFVGYAMKNTGMGFEVFEIKLTVGRTRKPHRIHVDAGMPEETKTFKYPDEDTVGRRKE